MKKRLGLGAKFGIAFASVAVAAGAVVGFMKLYSEHHKGLKIEIRSDFSTSIPAHQVQKANFVDGTDKPVASYDLNNATKDTPVTLLVDLGNEKAGKVLSYKEFFQLFAEVTNDLPRFKLEAGPIVFKNEYVESLLPHEFIQYTNWFLNNVSWGPDLLTLRQFKLGRGVKINGNSITLGQHGGSKEQTEIEFYPDGFFGSLPLYSALTGSGNHPDRLTNQLNTKGMLKEELEAYVKNIPWLISYQNAPANPAGMKLIETIKYAKNLYVFDASSYLNLDKDPLNFPVWQTFSQLNASNLLNLRYLVTGKDQAEVAKKALAILKELVVVKGFTLKPEHQFASLKISDQTLYKFSSISDVTQKAATATNPANPANPAQQIQNLAVEITGKGGLVNGAESDLKLEVSLYRQDHVHSKYNPQRDPIVYGRLDSAVANAFVEITKNAFNDYLKDQVNFKNLYAANVHLTNKTLLVYDHDQTKVNSRFYFSKTQAAQAEVKDYDLAKLKQITIKQVNKKSNNELELITTGDEIYTLKQPTNNKKGYSYDARFDDSFNTLKVAIHYYDTFTPRVIESNTLFVDGKVINVYKIYTDIYSGLIDKVVNKSPHLLKEIDGLHAELKEDENGILQYELKDGKYRGFGASDRLPYIAVVAQSDPGFESTGIDYLKYVGAHEYGHHQTLQYIKDTSNQKVSSIVGAIDNRAGVSFESFHNTDVLQLYLDARSSGLKVRITDNTYQPNKKGAYTNFNYNVPTQDKPLRWENAFDIFGSVNGQNPDELLMRTDRRFLQHFDDVKTASQARNIKPFDFYLMNSFDHESGTVNPAINDSINDLSQLNAMYFRKDSQQGFNFNSVNGFKGLKYYEGIVKDGVGNPIKFDANGLPVVFELADPTKVRGPYQPEDIKVLIKTRDNIDVVDPRNYLVTNEAGSQQVNINRFVQAAVQIRNSILNLIVTQFGINGWDSKVNGFNLSNAINNSYSDDFVVRNFNPGMIGSNEQSFRELNKFFFENPKFSVLKRTNAAESVATIPPINKLWLNIRHPSKVWDINTPNENLVGISTIFRDFADKVPTDVSPAVVQQARALALRHNANPGNFPIFSKYNYFGLAVESANGDYYVAQPDTEVFYNSANLKGAAHFENLINPLDDKFKLLQADKLFDFWKTKGLKPLTTLATNDLTKQAGPDGTPPIRPIFQFETLNNVDKVEDLKKPENFNFVYNLGKSAEPLFNYFANQNPAATQPATPAPTTATDTTSTPTKSPFVFNTNKKAFEVKSLDDLYELISIDPTKYTIGEVTNPENGQTVARARQWNLEYVQQRFNLKKYYDEVVQPKLTDEAKASYTYEVFLKTFGYSTLMDQFADNLTYLVKSPKDLTLDKLNTLEHIFDGEFGLRGYGSFGAKIFQNAYAAPKLNKANKFKPGKDDIDYRSTEVIVNEIKKYFTRFNIKPTNIHLGQILALTYGFDVTVVPDVVESQGANPQAIPFYLRRISQNDGLPSITTDLKTGEKKRNGKYWNSTLNDLNNSRMETKLNDVFSDYTYNISEVLTRDYVQITYAPSEDETKNLPNYITGLNEFNTGNERVFAGDNTKQWLSRTITPFFVSGWQDNRHKINIWSLPIMFALRDHAKFADATSESLDSYYQTNKDIYDAIAKGAIDQNTRPAIVQKLQAYKLDLLEVAKKLTENKNAALLSYDSYEVANNARPTYIGRTTKTNNGFFKDRWLRKVLGWEIYDDKREPIVDNNIKITELDNKTKVTDRARALWMYTLKSQGVGDRTLSGIHRNKETDTTLLWGFIPKAYKDKVKYIALENKTTKQLEYIKVSTNNTSNMFYLKKQSDLSSKVTLEDEGYVAWTSDYAILSNFSNSLIDLDAARTYGSNFRLFFVDENKKEIQNLMSLGSVKYIGENGKAASTAPIYANKNETDNQVYIRISNQFSI
ncbi:hypothetical protein JM47_00320 [Ureaplasma diversum]|uniref:PDxFFG protein n=1 Tax=Ureaplasma diversum TaxID=42094 RepID=A0A0C5RL14_9BACT|nr:PDxFFG protein [Ureaplasma diversum]AJQ45112.1 hypothetical protein JM47_00320 [Ureaplasma diversum]